MGFNYRTESNKYVVNCQLSTKTYEKRNGKSKKTGKWKFYQDVRATVSDFELILEGIVIISNIIVKK